MVFLKCVQEGSRLRVKILSPGYLNQTNCQFPRSIRSVGTCYTCPDTAITLVSIRGTYYYRVNKNAVTVLDRVYDSFEDYFHENPNEISDNRVADSKRSSELPQQVFTDADNPDCSICLTEGKSVIYVPCGHFVSCKDCDRNLKKRTCPICRQSISHTITPDQMA